MVEKGAVGGGGGGGYGAAATAASITPYTFSAPSSTMASNSTSIQNSTGVKPNVGRYNSVTRDDAPRGGAGAAGIGAGRAPGGYPGAQRAPYVPKPPQASYNNPVVTTPLSISTGPFSNANAVRSTPGNSSPRSIMTYGTTFTAATHKTSTSTSSANKVNGGAAMAVVRVTYIPSMPDELSISPGEMLRIASAYDDGWALCVNGRGEQGMVPLECLEGGPGQFGGYQDGSSDGSAAGGSVYGNGTARNSRRASSLAGAGRSLTGGQGR